MHSLFHRYTTLFKRTALIHSGFTLIELLIVMGLMAVATFGGIAGYRQFNTRQIVVTAGKEFLVNLRQAQSKSVSGVKSTTGCNTTQLAGYVVASSTDLLSYTVSETYTVACNGGTSHQIKSVNLASGLKFQSGFSFTYTGVSGSVTLPGASPLQITLCNANCGATSKKYVVSVSKDGLIQDLGLQ